jgi:hypothetical protein
MYTTSEIPIAAYLRMKGVKLLSATSDQNGKFVFKFDNSSNSCESFAIEFLNSDFSTFDAHLKTLKKMVYAKSR